MSKLAPLLLALQIVNSLGQDKDPNARWEKAIADFEARDKAAPPAKNGFLFVGSSSIRMWKLDESFPGFGAINRGFGGSEIENSTHFAERIIIPHQPHTILLYAGDNDIAKGKDADRVIADYKAFVTKVHTALPETHIAFIAIKPSLSRWKLWPEMKRANDAIAAICAKDDALTYLDIAAVTLGDDGKPQPEFFLDDGLHCSKAGYAAWDKVVLPYLESRRSARGEKERPATDPDTSSAAPIDDLKIRRQFTNQLAALLDAGKTVSPDTLAEQLKQRRSTQRRFESVAPPADVSSVYRGAREGVLCLGNIFKCDRCDDWHGNIAGGFVISADGLAVTNYHVMENDKAKAFGAMSFDGTLYPIAEVVASSEADDIAIVRLEGDKFHPLPVSATSTPGAGVTVISHPEGRFYTVSKGIVSRYYRSRSRDRKGRLRMAITADYARGSSGCPVLDENGAVVGVVASTNSIYYSKKEGIDRNLQMVVKSCVPSSAILERFAGRPD